MYCFITAFRILGGSSIFFVDVCHQRLCIPFGLCSLFPYSWTSSCLHGLRFWCQSHWSSCLARWLICNLTEESWIPENNIFAMLTRLLLFLWKIMPQAICTRYGLTVGATVAPFVHLLLWVFYPIAYPISKVNRFEGWFSIASNFSSHRASMLYHLLDVGDQFIGRCNKKKLKKIAPFMTPNYLSSL